MAGSSNGRSAIPAVMEILMNDGSSMLELRNISKTFPGVKALDRVSFQIKPGRVHALMGENGAGKSTLMKCIFGIYRQDEGEIFLNGNLLKIENPRQALDSGIAMIHQELQPIRTRSAMENIWAGRIPSRRFLGVRWVDDQKMLEDTKSLFEELGIDIDPRAIVGNLSSSHCQLLEIARAVSSDARVIIMDEPTSSLTEAESKLLFGIIRKLSDKGVSIVFISHKIDEVLEISQEVTIMRDGKVVGTWPTNELDNDLIVKRMVGREINHRFPPKTHTPGNVILEIQEFTSARDHSFTNVTLSLRKGEVLGIGGLVGSQRTELVESIFGLHPIRNGKLLIHGEEARIESPGKAIKYKMALLTEDRRVSGIFPKLTVMENMTIAKQSSDPAIYRKGPFLSDPLRIHAVNQYIDAFAIKTASLKTFIKYLSGGNQQKVLLGRWMLTDPEILILDEPTRGIDAGAKYEIYSLIEKMANNGKAIIMISSEMPELLGMSDRIAVMCEGRLSGIIDGKTATSEQVMHLASSYRLLNKEQVS